MIYHMIHVKAAIGRDDEAIRWLKQLAAYSNEVNPGAVVEILSRLDGPMNEYIWFGQTESLATHEEGGKLFQADPRVQALFQERHALFTESEQHLYQVL